MLKLEKVNKYYNKKRKNQIHVIDNTSLNLGNKGLVALLGPSGCGKTTLLNTIGGLDKINSGKIYVNNERITKRSSSKIDKIRNVNIGYIFQDYNLIDNITVYDNVTLTLRMIGFKNKDEIKKRVSYVLEKVNMYRYRNRLAGMLSGGERQRVGIARAIVKNPNIILADEPTGNLDSKNTIEIMNIIKSISQDKLVILVTHEKDLAYFYASRIIELQDGKIVVDKDNNHEKDLDYRLDNKIYLKDFKSHDKINKNNCKLDFYSDNEEELNVEIAIRNNNIYIKNNTNNKIEVIDESSSIEFVDDHYKKISKSDYENYKFDLEELSNKDKKVKYTSIFNPITLLVNGFKKIFDYTFLKKLLLLGFTLSAMFILYSISNIVGVSSVHDKDFIQQHRDYLTIVMNDVEVKDYLAYEKLDGVSYLLPGDSIINLEITNKDFYQVSNAISYIKGSLASINMINEDKLIMGKMPSNSNEIVLDKMVIDAFLDEYSSKQIGIINDEDLLDREVSVGKYLKFKIVGIIDNNNPSIYTNEDNFVNMIAQTNNYAYDSYSYYKTDSLVENDNSEIPVIDYNTKSGSVTLTKGRKPSKDYEVVVNIDNKDSMPLNKRIDVKVNGTKLKVVGYYTDKYSSNIMYTNNNTVKYSLIENKNNIIVYGENKEELLNIFKEKNVNIEDSYTKARKEYVETQRDNNTIMVVIASIILVVSFVEMFLIIRSSFLSRIKEVGILRAIGVMKKDIYKMFLGEIIAITSTASMLGYIFMIYVINQLMKVKYLESMYALNAQIIIFGILIIYLFNIIVGLLPVANTLRKTPAAILSRNDVD
ncbi:MAG TPA: ABC transporter ATP-binding protein/permease [Bacilli bacterium]|nr:ABC transporter ATP-binding protein/permease [Bacilli bacterium]